ncbi:MAG TPA: methyltransferase domain-containing protein [Thermoanaerobaculia bacterium]|nr:methyltransferase domain-containing protein [Thermoanaerobaculia bacterium]
MSVADRDYILGTHDEEVARLRLQHAVWRPRALDAWRRAGFNAGQTIVDIGSGPGYASLDLAEIASRVIALDRSARFLDVLRARNNPRIEAHEVDLDRDPLPVRDADGAWARWVFAFVQQPRDLLARTRDALRPRGTIVIHEYIDYRSWRVSPQCDEHDEFVAAVIRSWRASGGEPDIGRDLPRWAEELGFEIRSMQPIVDVVRPTDFAWHWPIAFMRSGLRRLLDLGEISAERGEAIARAFAALERDRHAIMINPVVLEIIAVRH